MKLIKRIIFFIIICFTIIIPLLITASTQLNFSDENLKNAIKNKIILINNDIAKLSENQKFEIANRYLEKSELLYYLLQLEKFENTDGLEQLKNEYISSLKLSQKFYEESENNSGVFLCKSKILRFEIVGIEEINDIEKFKVEISKKINQDILAKPIEQVAQDIKNSAAAQQNSENSEKSDTIIATVVSEDLQASNDSQKPDTFYSEAVDTSVNITADTIQEAFKPIAKYEKIEPKYMINEQSPISPVLRKILFTEKLEKEYEIEQTRGLLGFRDREFGKTKLTISGQKTIDFIYSGRKYNKRNESISNTSDFKIDQSLEVKVRGKVGDNVEVNIDYDDKRTAANRQQLSIEYKSDEYVLSKSKNKNIFSATASFGDIVLSLPSTEFVSYRRNLFGIKGGLKLRNVEYSLFKADQFNLDLIVSRTKGEPGYKEFYGSSGTRIITLRDIDYTKNKYFRIVTGIGNDTDILAGSLKVYIDDNLAYNNQGNIDTRGIIVTPTNPNYTELSSETFSFTLLQEIRDYVYDLKEQILTFNRYIDDGYTISVSYQTKSGYSVNYKIIRKDKQTQYTDTFAIYAVRNYYNLGVTNINKNDPDLLIRIQDTYNGNISDTMVGADTRSFLYIFGLDRTGPGFDGLLGTVDDAPDGKIDDEYIDYENGIIKFPDNQPFNNSLAQTLGLARSEIYTRDNPASRYRFYVQVKAQLQYYPLDAFDIVRNSEIVKVNGRTLSRNVDYYIDYESGMLIFLDPSLITSSSKITVEYEKVPFGASANKTLFGTRFEGILNQNFRFGTTLIKNQNDKPNEMPTIDATPQGSSVREVDFEIKPVNYLFDLINSSFNTKISAPSAQWFDIKLMTEVARSEFDPNIYGSAMIDDMESSKDAIDINLSYKSWNNTYISESTLPQRLRGFIEFEETDINENIGHKTELDKDESNQKSLRLKYDLDNGAGIDPDTWFAARTLISKDGVDISKKKYLELWIHNADSFYLTIDLGQINEDVDGDGLLDQEDGLFVDGSPTSPQTLDGKLNKTPNEDIGIIYNTFYDTKTIGAGNGRLDSEDMNSNGRLDQLEAYYRYAKINLDNFADDTGIGKVINGVPYRFYRINLDKFTEAINTPSKTNIKHIRLLFVQKENVSAPPNANIHIDYISIVGSVWEDANITDTYFIVGTKNNIDDNYARFETELQMRKIETVEGDRAAREQALYLNYTNLTNNNYDASNFEYYTKREYARAINISKYKNFIFYVKTEDNNDNGETVFIRLGDKNNFFEYKFRAPMREYGWRKIEIPLDRFRAMIQEITTNDTRVPFDITFGENNEYRIRAQSVRPSFYNIKMIQIGVIGDSLNPITGDLFINTMYVDGAMKETGIARKTHWQTKFYKDIFTFNMREDYRENTFRSIDEISSSVNQTFIPEKSAQKKYDGTIAFGRLLPESWKITMPMSGSYTKSEIEVEPDAAQEVERAKIGNTLTTNKTFSTSFSKSKLPLLSLNYSQNETTKDLIESKYNILNESLNSSASYSIDFQKTIFGEMIGFKYIPLLNKIPAGKELKVNLNYQYNYTIDDKNYILGSEQSAFDKFTTYYKKIGVISRPFNWIRLQPELALTDKYHRTKLYDGLENKIQQASLNVDINKFLGLKPSFDFGRTEDLRYDISRPDSEPTENYNYNAGIRLDVYPVDWWKLLKFIDSRFNVSGKYTETLNVDQIIKTKDSSINGTFGVDVSLRPKEIWKYLEFITMTYSYNNNVSAVYSKISNNYDFNDIFKDYFDKYFWLWKDKAYTQLSDTIDLQFNRTSASNAQTHSFNGQLFLWSPLNLRYNYNFKNSFSQVQGSENYNNTRNIQLNSRLDLVKGLKWFKNTRRSSLNLDYSYSEDENGNFKQSITEVLTHNTTLGLEVVWTEKFNTSFSMNFPQSKKNMQTEYGVSVEKSFSYSPKISWSYYTANPFKLFKPFTKKQWLFQNKLNLNGSFSYSLQKAELLRTDNILQKTQDAMQYGATFGAQYDMSDFLRLSADSKFNINKDNINENNDYTEYSFSIKTIIIF